MSSRPLDLSRPTPEHRIHLDIDEETLRDVAEALRTFALILPLNSRDWAAEPMDALLYAALVGWGCEEHLDPESGPCSEDDCGGDGAFDAVADRFGWSPEQRERVCRYRAAVRTLAG